MAGGSLRQSFFWDFVRNQYDPYWLPTEDIFCETLAHYLSSGSFIPQVGQWHEYFKRGFVYHSEHNIRKKWPFSEAAASSDPRVWDDL